MSKIQVEIPEDIADELESKDQKYISQLLSLGLKQLKMQEALTWVKEGQASIGYGAEYAGVSREEMAKYAYSQGIKPAFSEETVAEELGNR